MQFDKELQKPEASHFSILIKTDTKYFQVSDQKNKNSQNKYKSVY